MKRTGANISHWVKVLRGLAWIAISQTGAVLHAQVYRNTRGPWDEDIPSNDPAAGWVVMVLIVAPFAWGIFKSLSNGHLGGALKLLLMLLALFAGLWLLAEVGKMLA